MGQGEENGLERDNMPPGQRKSMRSQHGQMKSMREATRSQGQMKKDEGGQHMPPGQMKKQWRPARAEKSMT